MQFRPKIVPQLPQTNLAYSENCTDFILFDGKSSQFTIRSEIRNSGEGANILQIRITENAMAFQFPENADHHFRVAAAADYNNCIRAFLDLQRRVS